MTGAERRTDDESLEDRQADLGHPGPVRRQRPRTALPDDNPEHPLSPLAS